MSRVMLLRCEGIIVAIDVIRLTWAAVINFTYKLYIKINHRLNIACEGLGLYIL